MTKKQSKTDQILQMLEQVLKYTAPDTSGQLKRKAEAGRLRFIATVRSVTFPDLKPLYEEQATSQTSEKFN